MQRLRTNQQASSGTGHEFSVQHGYSPRGMYSSTDVFPLETLCTGWVEAPCCHAPAASPGPQLSGRARHGHVLGAMHHDARRHALQGQGLVYFERCLCSRGCTLTKRRRRGWVLHLVSRPLPSRPIVSPIGGSWAMGTALLTHHLGRLRLASTAISLLWSL